MQLNNAIFKKARKVEKKTSYIKTHSRYIFTMGGKIKSMPLTTTLENGIVERNLNFLHNPPSISMRLHL